MRKKPKSEGIPYDRESIIHKKQQDASVGIPANVLSGADYPQEIIKLQLLNLEYSGIYWRLSRQNNKTADPPDRQPLDCRSADPPLTSGDLSHHSSALGQASMLPVCA